MAGMSGFAGGAYAGRPFSVLIDTATRPGYNPFPLVSYQTQTNTRHGETGRWTPIKLSRPQTCASTSWGASLQRSTTRPLAAWRQRACKSCWPILCCTAASPSRASNWLLPFGLRPRMIRRAAICARCSTACVRRCPTASVFLISTGTQSSGARTRPSRWMWPTSRRRGRGRNKRNGPPITTRNDWRCRKQSKRIRAISSPTATTTGSRQSASG